MHKWKLLLVLLAAAICTANGRPTLDVLYKIAKNFENELLSDSHGPPRDPYLNHRHRYGPPHGNGYYPPHSNRLPPHNVVYPSPYPSPYPAPYPSPYPGAYPPGPYHAEPPSNRQYPPTNYIHGPTNIYDDRYQSNLGANGYGDVSGPSSYPYGENIGYKKRGY